MSAPPFSLAYAATVVDLLEEMRQQPQHARKLKKITKALKLPAEVGPDYPGLQTHKMEALRGDNGEAVWNSYVENRTPSAWRILWIYKSADEIEIVSIGPHP